jgi:acetylornithine deacetylase
MEELREEIVRVLCELVAIPSVNPIEGPLAEGFGEAAAAEYVEKFLREAGLETSRQEVLPGRPNVVGLLAGDPGTETLLLDAHLDTVSAEGMEIAAFEPKVEEERIWGRGACDAKGCLAAMLVAVKRAAQGAARPRASIMLSATVDEEHLARGLKALLESGPAATMAIVGEPTNLEVATAHRGLVRWVIRTRGKAAHSSRPQEGENAIYRMARIVNALEAYSKRGVGRESHPLLGRGQLTVGVIRGGTQVNVVPDLCEIEIDRRLLPSEEARRAMADVHQYLANASSVEASFEHSDPSLVSPALDVSSEEPVARLALDAVRAVLGRAPIAGLSGDTHAGKLTEAGIPSVVLGPGQMGQAHTARESVAIEQLVKAVQVYEEIIRQAGGAPS